MNDETVCICYFCDEVIVDFKRPGNRMCIDETPGFKEYVDVCSSCKKKPYQPHYNADLAYLVENG